MRKTMNNTFKGIDELPLALRIEDLMSILSIGRNTAYDLVHSGQIQSFRVGRQLRIPRDSFVEFLNGGKPSIH